MATFSVPPSPDPNRDAPAVIWNGIKTILSNGAASVEIVVIDPAAANPQFQLRVWNSVRQDKSNAPGADPTKNY